MRRTAGIKQAVRLREPQFLKVGGLLWTRYRVLHRKWLASNYGGGAEGRSYLVWGNGRGGSGALNANRAESTKPEDDGGEAISVCADIVTALGMVKDYPKDMDQLDVAEFGNDTAFEAS